MAMLLYDESGLSVILERARKAYEARLAELTVGVLAPVTEAVPSSSSLNWEGFNAFHTQMNDLGWGFADGRQIPVLGREDMDFSLLRFVRKPDPAPGSPPSSGVARPGSEA